MTTTNMPLVLLLRAPTRFREEALQAAIISHRLSMSVDEVITVGRGGDVNLPIDTPRELNRALLRVSGLGIPERFVLSQDNTIVTGPYDPLRSRCHIKSNWLKRKGAETTAMVGAITYLISQGKPTFDYEIELPSSMLCANVSDILSAVPGANMHIRTVYHNAFGGKPIRTEDPVVPLWVHSFKPITPGVVTLDGTCYRHAKCMRWITDTIDRMLHASS